MTSSDFCLPSPLDDHRKALFHKIRKAAQNQRKELSHFLQKLAGISSQTADRAGVDRAMEMVASAMPARFAGEVIAHDRFAACRFFAHEVPGKAPIALMGHLDTVVPDGFDRVTIEGERMIGPAVADMKGGVTVLVWALRLLEEQGLLKEIPVRVLFNTDEEVNSPWSRTLVPRFKGCRAGLVFEVGGAQNEIVTTRIGISVFRLKAHGVASHAGTGRKPKASAVHEIALRIAELEAFNRDDFLVNVGSIQGGRTYNFVPDVAEAVFAIRYWDRSQEEDFVARLEAAVAKPRVEGCRLELEKITGRPPLKPDRACEALFHLCQQVATELGSPVSEEKRPGGSDASFLLALGFPVLDGFGPRGEFDFSLDEYIDIGSLVERTALVASLLVELGRQSE